MSLKLQQQPALEAGDPARFAFRVEFLENLDPGGATPEEDLSWGKFQIWAGGRNLCEHVDRGEVRKSVEWYLLPMLEWLTDNWDCLLHEQRPPTANAGDSAWESLTETNQPEKFDRPTGWDQVAAEAHSAWTARHSWRSCRSGGLFPDVVVRRWLHEVELSWGETSVAGAPEGFRFLHGQGALRLAPEDVAKPLFMVLSKAADLLCAAGLESARLVEFKSRVTALDDFNRQLDRTAVMAGLGGRMDEWQARWKRLREKLAERFARQGEWLREWLEPTGNTSLCVSGSCEAAVMFGSASPTLTEADVLELAVRLVEASKEKSPSQWAKLANNPQPWRSGLSAWRDGYRLAGLWAEQSGLRTKSGAVVDIEDHLSDLGVRVGELELSDEGTAGLAVQPGSGAPHVFINRRHPRCQFPTGRRFILAHELCHLLHDHAQGQSLALISGSWAPRELEQRANAFAAALLMPYNTLKSAFNALGGKIDNTDLLALARRLKVSTDALAHHLANCGLISEATRDVLLAQLVNRPNVGAATRGPTRRRSRN